MTYSPAQVSTADGTDYFEQIGILGGLTNMSPLLSMSPTLSLPDGTATGSSMTLTDSVYQRVSGTRLAFTWHLDGARGLTSYSKVLVMGYLHGNDNIMQGLGVSSDAFGPDYGDGDDLTDTILLTGRDFDNATEIRNWDAASAQTVLSTDSTIMQEADPTAAVTGYAVYCESGLPGIVKGYLRFGGRAQWMQVASLTPTCSSSKSLVWYGAYGGAMCRLIAPVMAWGI